MPRSQKEPALEQRLFGAREAACLGNGAVQGKSLRLMPFCAIIEQVFAKRRFRDVRRKGSSMKLGNIARARPPWPRSGRSRPPMGRMASMPWTCPIATTSIASSSAALELIRAIWTPYSPRRFRSSPSICRRRSSDAARSRLQAVKACSWAATTTSDSTPPPCSCTAPLPTVMNPSVFAPSTTLAWSMRCRRNRVSRAWRRRSPA